MLSSICCPACEYNCSINRNGSDFLNFTYICWHWHHILDPVLLDLSMPFFNNVICRQLCWSGSGRIRIHLGPWIRINVSKLFKHTSVVQIYIKRWVEIKLVILLASIQIRIDQILWIGIRIRSMRFHLTVCRDGLPGYLAFFLSDIQMNTQLSIRPMR